MLLDDYQVKSLAKSFVGMVDKLTEFYSDPENKKKYQEWHLQKYGCLPKEVEVQ